MTDSEGEYQSYYDDDPRRSSSTPTSHREDDELKRLRSSMAGAGYDMKKMSAATPSSPAIPAEITEALIAHERLCMVDLRRAFASDDPAREMAPITKSIFDSRSALLALYNRQREEAEEAYQELQLTKERFIAQSDAEIAALSSQLERLTDENEALRNECSGWQDLTEAAESSLERLKASQLTAEEARVALWWIEGGDPNEASTDTSLEDSAREKLSRISVSEFRLRSLSDTPK